MGRVAALRHHGVKNRAAVAFRKNEAVAILPFRIGGIVLHHVHEKSDDDFGCGERSAGMAGLGFGDHFDHFAPHLLGDGREFGRITGLLHHLHPDGQHSSGTLDAMMRITLTDASATLDQLAK